MVKVVVLDGFAVRGGDLSWDILSGIGEYTVYERTPYGLIPQRASGVPAVLTNKCRLDRAALDRLPDLQYIGVLATGYDNIDAAAAKERGITVTNVPAYSTESVVQSVFALMLEAVSRVGEHNASVKRGDWQNAPDFCYYIRPLTELFGKTLGIVGYGGIGRRVKEVANAFGMNVVCYNKGKVYPAEPMFCAVPSLEELYRQSDILSLNCPLTPDNRGMINRAAIARMKDGAVIVNTARGGLINEKDAAEALASGKLGALAADVLSAEPADPANPLLKQENCILTPHVAWATKEARSRLMAAAAGNLRAFLDGKPVNTIV